MMYFTFIFFFNQTIWLQYFRVVYFAILHCPLTYFLAASLWSNVDKYMAPTKLSLRDKERIYIWR